MKDFYSLYFKDTASATVFGEAVLNTKRRKAMSYTVSTLSLRNLEEVFGQIDPLRRRAAIDEILHEDAVFHDPNGGIYYGRDEIDRIAGVIKGNHPDFRYQPISPPEEMGAGPLHLGQPWQAAGLRRHRFHYGPGRQIAAVHVFFDELPSLRPGTQGCVFATLGATASVARPEERCLVRARRLKASLGRPTAGRCYRDRPPLSPLALQHLDFQAFCGREKLTALPARKNADAYDSELGEDSSDLRICQIQPQSLRRSNDVPGTGGGSNWLLCLAAAKSCAVACCETVLA